MADFVAVVELLSRILPNNLVKITAYAGFTDWDLAQRIVAVWATIWATCDTARLVGLPPGGSRRVARLCAGAACPVLS
jgi:hypothetical protein